MSSKWSKDKHNFLIDLRTSGKYTWKQIAEKMTAKFPHRYNGEQCRSHWRQNRHTIKIDDPKAKYGREFKRLKDGTFEVDELIEISREQEKDEEYILRAHGYNPDRWVIVEHRLSEWQHHNRDDGTINLRASRIRVKPKENEFDWKKFLETVKDVPKVTIRPKSIKRKADYLLLPLFDMHFGISDYKYYMSTQAKILDKLENDYKKVTLIFGQDAFHNDDFHGRTTKGTQIQKVDMIQAWEDAKLFFEPIIKKALERSEVEIFYSKGNHSETVEWAFVQYLKARYPQCKYDDSLKERKVTMLGKNFIGMNHGDKKNEKRLPENFATEFPLEWANATTRTVFTGHRHAELVEDAGGILVRRMPTKNITDDWHDDMGYTTAHKRFQIHEYDEEGQIALYYI